MFWFFAHLHEAPAGVGLDVAQRQAGVLGDLLVGEAVVDGQAEHAALFGLEFLQRLAGGPGLVGQVRPLVGVDPGRRFGDLRRSGQL